MHFICVVIVVTADANAFSRIRSHKYTLDLIYFSSSQQSLNLTFVSRYEMKTNRDDDAM